MKLLIAGSRTFSSEENYKYLRDEIYNLQDNYNISCIISGKAKGADSLGERFAKEHNIMIEEYPAEWDLYGKRAGVVRNELMGKQADFAIIFWDGSSKGTQHMIKYMRGMKKPCKVCFYNDKDEYDEW